MLDYNSTSRAADAVNAAIDAALQSSNAATPPRGYLGGSRLGHACERALQFEFARAPKDEGADFSGRLLRIFGIGHALEDLAVAWLRGAGFDLYTRKGNRAADLAADIPRGIEATGAAVIPGSELTDVGGADKGAGADLTQKIDASGQGRRGATEQRGQRADAERLFHPRPLRWQTAS